MFDLNADVPEANEFEPATRLKNLQQRIEAAKFKCTKLKFKIQKQSNKFKKNKIEKMEGGKRGKKQGFSFEAGHFWPV